MILGFSFIKRKSKVFVTYISETSHNFTVNMSKIVSRVKKFLPKITYPRKCFVNLLCESVVRRYFQLPTLFSYVSARFLFPFSYVYGGEVWLGSSELAS